MSALIECWSCKSTIGLSDVSDADGLCPRCDAEIDLDGHRLAAIDTLRTANQRLEVALRTLHGLMNHKATTPLELEAIRMSEAALRGNGGE